MQSLACIVPIGFAETVVYRSEGTTPNPTPVDVRFWPEVPGKYRVGVSAVIDPLPNNGGISIQNLDLTTPWYAGSGGVSGRALGGKTLQITVPQDNICLDRTLTLTIVSARNETGTNYACVDTNRNTMTIIVKDYGDC